MNELRGIKNSIIPQGFPRDIWGLFFTSVISAIGFSITMPYMSLYLNTVLKIPMTIVGLILMIAQVIGASVGLLGGEISDRFGRKYIMIRSLFSRFILFLSIGLVILKWRSIIAIFLFLILNSILFSFYIPASQAYIADLISEEKRISAYGLLRMGGNLGWALGPAIGGLLATIDYAYLFFVTAIFMIIAFFVIINFCQESLQFKEKMKTNLSGQKERVIVLRDIFSVINDQRFFIFTIISFMIFIVWGQLVSPISIYTVNRVGITKSQLGLLFSINGFMVALFQYFVTYFVPDKKELDGMVIGALVYAVGYLSVGFANGFALLVVSMVIITIAEMVITPATQTYASKIAKPESRGRYLAFYNLAQTFGWAFGPFLGGILLDIFPGKSIFIWGIIGFIAIFSAIGFRLYKSYWN